MNTSASPHANPAGPVIPGAGWLAGRFARIMTGDRRMIPEIDGLRFIAIAAVVMYHLRENLRATALAGLDAAPGCFESLLGTGYYGVNLFFAISGFLLALPFARARLAGARPVGLWSYFKRRLTRLEPPYLLAMLGWFLAGVIVHRPGASALWPNLLAGFVYQHNLIFGQGNLINGVAWSLEVEVQFYVLTPFLADRIYSIGDKRLRRGLLLLLVLVASILSSTIGGGSLRYRISLLGHLQEFLVGYLLADLFVSDWRESPEASGGWDLVSVVGWPILFVTLAFFRAANVLLPFVVLALYVAALRGRYSRTLLRVPWIVAAGGTCYTVYLLHHPIVRQLGTWIAPHLPSGQFATAYLASAVILLPPVLLASAIFFLAVERPCMNPRWPAALTERVRGTLARLRGYRATEE